MWGNSWTYSMGQKEQSIKKGSEIFYKGKKYTVIVKSLNHVTVKLKGEKHKVLSYQQIQQIDENTSDYNDR